MDRRAFLTALGGGLLAAPLVSVAQPPKSTVRIGFLASSSPERERSRLVAFRQGLRDRGYSDGQNVLVEPRYAAGQLERLPGLARELVSLKMDILVAAGSPAAHAAKSATSSIPIVVTNAADPVGTGLVASLARPGGNVTGLSDFNDGVVAKRLQLLKEVIPGASRVAVLMNPANRSHPIQVKLIRAEAPALGVKILSFEAADAEGIDRAFFEITRERAQALVVVADPLFGALELRIVELAARNRLPAMHGLRQAATIGGLMSYGTNFDDLYRQAAIYVDKILKGAKPGDLPIEQPTKFELVINLKTARALGLTIPPSLLQRADQVIE
jgi:ABC-type uncharacterized transport system substrate-binding protein